MTLTLLISATAAFASLFSEVGRRSNAVGGGENSGVTPDREGLQKELDVLTADGTLSRSHGFKIADAAAKGVLSVAAPLSKQYGLEVGGNIYLGDDGLYHYTLPAIGDSISVPIDHRWTGYHTHPSGSLKFSNSHYGAGLARDLHWVNQSGKALYLGVQQSGGVGYSVCEPSSCFDTGRRGSSGRVFQ